jgi:hypothetical protein
MEHSSKNENKLNETCDDIFMNEVVMEEHNVEKEYEINPFCNLKLEEICKLIMNNK